MPAGIPAGAMCVQRFDDSLNSAIHITYRISLRSSSMPEPRDPLLKVLTYFFCIKTQKVRLLEFNCLGPAAGAGRLKRAELSGPLPTPHHMGGFWQGTARRGNGLNSGPQKGYLSA
jgi:hypothetical protein